MDADTFRRACGVLAELHRSGHEVRADESGLHIKPRMPERLRAKVVPYRDELVELLAGADTAALAAMSFEEFEASRSAVAVFSTALKETVVFVSDDDMAGRAYDAGLVPYTAAELRTIATDGREALALIHGAKLRLLHEAKAVFRGEIIANPRVEVEIAALPARAGGERGV